MKALHKKGRSSLGAMLMALLLMLQMVQGTVSFADETGAADTGIIKVNGIQVFLEVNGEKKDISALSADYFVNNPINMNTKIVVKYDFITTEDVPEDTEKNTEGIGYLPIIPGLDYSDLTNRQNVGDFDLVYDSVINNKRLIVYIPEGKDAGTKGKYELETDFVIDPASDNPEKTYTIPLAEGGEKTFTVKFKPEIPQKDINVEKTGEPVKLTDGTAASFNAQGAKWQIDINKGLAKVDEPTITDSFDPAKMKLYKVASDALDGTDVTSSFTVHKLDVKLNGTTTVGDEVTGGFTATKTDAGFVFKFDNPISEAYRITYLTEFLDTSGAAPSYANSANFNKSSSEANVSYQKGSSLEKEGKTDRDYNPEKITWTMYLNKSESTYNSMSLVDAIPSGLVLDKESIKITEHDLDSKGNVKGEGTQLKKDTDYSLTEPDSASDNTMTIDFETERDKALKVVFDTNISDYSAKSFRNEAQLTLNGDTENSLDVSATVDIKRSEMLEKSGGLLPNYGKDLRTIDWTVYFNLSQRDLANGATLTDSMPAGLRLVPDSVVVKSLGIKDDGQPDKTGETKASTTLTKGTDYSVTSTVGTTVKDEDSLALKFIKPGKSAFKVTYTTKVVDPTQTSFVNSAATGGLGVGIADVTKEANAIKVENNVTKTHGAKGINYEKKTMDWKMTIDPQKEPMNNMVIQDRYTNQGLILDEDTLVITYQKSDTETITMVKGTDYTLDKVYSDTADPDSRDGMNIKFKDPIKYPVTITYTTNFDRTKHVDYPKEVNNYENNATFTWKEESKPLDTFVANKDADYSVSTTAAPVNASKSGKFHNDDRYSRQIDWRVNVNYLSETLDSFTILDEIGAGQVLDPDSIKVYEYSRDSSGAMVDATDSVENPNEIYTIISTEDNEFEIRFNAISKPYSVRYSTKLVGISQESYENTAHVDGKEIKANQVAFSKSDEFIGKEGKQVSGSPWYVQWQVEVNESLSEIQNAKIEDKLSKGQAYDEESIKLERYTGANKREVVDPLEYTVKIIVKDGHQEMTLFFDDNPNDNKQLTINSQYRLTYRSQIVAKEDITLTNAVELLGEKFIVGEGENSTGGTVEVSISSFGSLTPPDPISAEIKLKKYNPELLKDNQLLEGVEFSVINKATGETVTTGKTDAKGELTFSLLPLGSKAQKYEIDYILRETKRADYQKISDQVKTFDKKNNTWELEVKNYKNRTIQVEKVDAANEAIKLQGAVFTLTNKITGASREEKTNAEGFLQFGEVEFGTYLLKEKTAPSGYYLSQQEQEIVIEEGTADEVTGEEPQLVFAYRFQNAKRPTGGGGGGGNTIYPPSLIIKPPAMILPPTNIPLSPVDPPIINVVTPTDKPVTDIVNILPEAIPTVLVPPENGQLTLSPDGSWEYVPNKGFKGKDKFTIHVENPDGTFEDIVVDIDVEEVPIGIPVMNNQATREGSLPKTSGIPSEIFYLTGTAGILLGVILRRNNKKK